LPDDDRNVRALQGAWIALNINGTLTASPIMATFAGNKYLQTIDGKVVGASRYRQRTCLGPPRVSAQSGAIHICSRFGFVAASVPAAHAARIDPVLAMRQD